MSTTMVTRSLRALVTSVSDHSFTQYQLNSANASVSNLGVSVDDLNSACERFEGLNVNWKKRLTDGRMKTVAFILDPDNYWIEVIQNEALKRTSNW